MENLNETNFLKFYNFLKFLSFKDDDNVIFLAKKAKNDVKKITVYVKDLLNKRIISSLAEKFYKRKVLFNFFSLKKYHISLKNESFKEYQNRFYIITYNKEEEERFLSFLKKQIEKKLFFFPQAKIENLEKEGNNYYIFFFPLLEEVHFNIIKNLLNQIKSECNLTFQVAINKVLYAPYLNENIKITFLPDLPDLQEGENEKIQRSLFFN